jgi:hypothetical protein
MPCLVLRFEAINEKILKTIKLEFKNWLEYNDIDTKNLSI